ncbi:MAG: VWA domain-containing protein [Ignavibacteria bacterium]|nr:VWA domain-containing protein [Ignavibacteria bacterium]MBT8383715.1 VWA domain-containing protein [Ignavibacteria bacterium]MBT8390702.1 VWA domain-containing protein [Ignavibacteria bacterium]NNJ53326.1 VWA domain-containing protein [Ignavibacteriaceae bacterium]NNL22264.1 VWA domain-containing protein [Ignavibacteriaceae bacterium]
MRRQFVFLLSFFTSLVLFGDKAVSNEKPNTNTVQLAILLDTSNSMDGLIDQTKTQLWKIVNEMARSKRDGQSINLYVALYEYGNDGLSADEGFVRLVASLTNDLDKISEELFKLQTNGGSEYCGTVISEAIKDLDWTKSTDEYKVIFIAGNEPFTQGEIDYKVSCKEAISKGIIINTIYCGNYDEGVQTNWKDGADLADGKYINIDQNQEIVHIDTPFDDELVELGQQLNDTYIAFGYEGDEMKMRQEEQDKNAGTLAPEVLVERTVTKGSGQYRNESWDLVDADREGTVEIEEIPEDQLPEEMQKMNVQERKAYVEKKAKEREKIQTQINELDKNRRDFIAQKLAENSEENTIDAAMLKIIREQASKKNYKFE